MYGSSVILKNNILVTRWKCWLHLLTGGTLSLIAKIMPGAVMKVQNKIITTTIGDSELLSMCTAGGQPPILFKIDVEGFEGFVVKGAESTLSKCPPRFIFIEIHKNLIDAHRQSNKGALLTMDIFMLLKKNKYNLLLAENGR